MEKIIKSYYRGEVYYANLGEKPEGVQDCEQYGIRPVIIIQNDIGNRYSPTVIVAAITSQINKTKLPTHVSLDWQYIGLKSESVVMLEQIRTLDKRKLLQKVGRISDNDVKKLNTAALVSLQLQEIENKMYKIIENKVEMIKRVDDQISFGVEMNVESDMYFNTLIKEREGLMKDLEEFCSSKGLNHNDFLKDCYKRGDNKVRKVC